MSKNSKVCIFKTIKSNPIKGLPFDKIKNHVLGKDYNLNLILIGETRSKKLNKKYRDKDFPTDILSFPIEKGVGEIYITPSVAKVKAKKHNQTNSQYLKFLFIHGLLHLKGMKHGSTMEKAEDKLMSKFGI